MVFNDKIGERNINISFEHLVLFCQYIFALLHNIQLNFSIVLHIDKKLLLELSVFNIQENLRHSLRKIQS